MIGASLAFLALVACDGDAETADGNSAIDSRDPQQQTPEATVCDSSGDCAEFGLPVALDVETSSLRDFPPKPGYRAAALPGEEVEVVTEGFAPGEPARLYSTDPSYDGTEYTADDGGNVRFTVQVDSGIEPTDLYFLIAQLPEGEEQGVAAAFIVAVLDPDLDMADLLDRALGEVLIPGE